MSLIADQKEMCLFWRTTKSNTKIAYFRKRIDGRDKWQSLGELSPDDARESVRKLRKLHALNLLNERLGFVSKQRSAVSSFRELFAAYDSYCTGIDIDRRTVENNKGCVSLILRRVLGERFDVGAASISLFNAQLIRDFAAVSVRARKAAAAAQGLSDEAARRGMESVQRTIKSTVQQARSVFARAALASSAYARLSLPDLGEVLRVVVGASSVVPYEPPSGAVIERIARDAGALRVSNPGLWLAFNLEVNAGLRRGSARLARWDWFVDHGRDARGERWVDLRVGVAKGGASVVRFDAGLYGEMLEVRGELAAAGGREPGELVFVLPGDSVKERDAVCGALVAWLRERGLDKRQPNHELRKLYGDRKYSEHGAEEAQRALGHSDSKLTSRVYASARARRALRVV